MNLRLATLVSLTCGLLASPASAAFHLIQIEELIGGISGNTNAQAVQLRMRFGGQPVVSLSRVRAWNATGGSPILLLDITDDVPLAGEGARILLASPAFNTLMAGVPGYHADFTLTNTIPASYLSGGKVTFEDDGGSILWSLAFGNYTGTNLGDGTNDTDFGAPFPTLPLSGRQGIRFDGLASDPSTNNFADYILTSDPATVTNNAGSTFTVVPEPASMSFIALGAAALGGILMRRRRG